MKVLYKNILENYDTITATNENGNYDIYNIFSTYLSLIFKTTDGDTVINVAFTEDQTADSFFMAYSDLAEDSEIEITYRDAADIVLFNETLLTDVRENGTMSTVKSYFTKLTTVRSIEITITNSSIYDVFFIGTIWIGESLLLPDYEAVRPMRFNNLAGYYKSAGLQVSGQIRTLARGESINFPLIETENNIDDFFDYLQAINNLPHFVDFNEDIDGRVKFVNITNNGLEFNKTQLPDFEYRNLLIEYEEAL